MTTTSVCTEGADIIVGVEPGDIEVFVGVGIPGPAGPGAQVTTINGQPMVTLDDSTRGNKTLSVGEQPLKFAENRLADQDWIRVGQANNALSGYRMDFDGTIVYCTGHCEDTGAESKDIHLYINGVDQGSVGTLSGGADVGFTNTTLDLDFSQDDKIRARAVGAGGQIEDTVIKVTVKWRG